MTVYSFCLELLRRHAGIANGRLSPSVLSVTLDIGDSLIKLHKTHLASDRTSCRSPRPNQSRVPAASLSRRFEQQSEIAACR